MTVFDPHSLLQEVGISTLLKDAHPNSSDEVYQRLVATLWTFSGNGHEEYFSSEGLRNIGWIWGVATPLLLSSTLQGLNESLQLLTKIFSSRLSLRRLRAKSLEDVFLAISKDKRLPLSTLLLDASRRATILEQGEDNNSPSFATITHLLGPQGVTHRAFWESFSYQRAFSALLRLLKREHDVFFTSHADSSYPQLLIDLITDKWKGAPEFYQRFSELFYRSLETLVTHRCHGWATLFSEELLPSLLDTYSHTLPLEKFSSAQLDLWQELLYAYKAQEYAKALFTVDSLMVSGLLPLQCESILDTERAFLLLRVGRYEEGRYALDRLTQGSKLLDVSLKSTVGYSSQLIKLFDGTSSDFRLNFEKLSKELHTPPTIRSRLEWWTPPSLTGEVLLKATVRLCITPTSRELSAPLESLCGALDKVEVTELPIEELSLIFKGLQRIYDVLHIDGFSATLARMAELS
jgi:hypothetical protein